MLFAIFETFFLAHADNGLNCGEFHCLHLGHFENINYSNLLGAAKYWDLETHVFRFGLNEMCPTFEEFSHLLIQETTLPLVTFIETRSPPTDFGRHSWFFED